MDVFLGVPTMYAAMLRHPDHASYDTSTLDLCVSGGAAMPVEVLRGFEDAFGCKVLEGYGLSETCAMATFNGPDRAQEGLDRSAGGQGGELRDFAKQRVAAYKYPRRVHIVDDLPKARRARSSSARSRCPGSPLVVTTEATLRLRDGASIRIRPIEPEDRAELAAGFERLSPESRFRRFLSPVARLSEHDLDYFTRVDHHDHEALVAFDAATDEGVAVARYVRTGPERAEPAVAVADDWQGRGVGTMLLDALAERAYESGIRCFEATVLATNSQALALLHGLGETSSRQEGREVVVEVPVPEPPGAGPPLLALLRAAATGLLAAAPRRAGRLG